jgi:hypothetical protein
MDIKKVHIAYGGRPLCRCRSKVAPEMRRPEGKIPEGVNCRRCVQSFESALRNTVGERREIVLRNFGAR